MTQEVTKAPTVLIVLFLLVTIGIPAFSVPLMNATVTFNTTFSSSMVLQQSPAKSAVYGMVNVVDNLENSPPIPEVNVTISSKYTTYSVVATVTPSPGGSSGLWHWKAFLKPTPMGGEYIITAFPKGSTSLNSSAVLNDVTFGDVWYCSGQSNMWLPLTYTYSRNKSVAGINSGKYDNIRLMAGDSQHSATSNPWMRTKTAVADGNTSSPTYTLFKFSAVCYYFAESLTDIFLAEGKSPPVLGLINTAIGGSMIEEWTLNSTTDKCANTSRGAHDQTLFDKNVRPYLGMSVKGWLWYQGENNCHGIMGNSLKHFGYGCQLPLMVDLWRKQWSADAGTTDPLAPFGVVTLAAGGSEGGHDIGGMRWSQTANFGMLPNSAMPNTFLSQTFDLGDPWGDKTCYKWKCCWNNYNLTNCGQRTAKIGGPKICATYCSVLRGTHVYMGGIHPRIKKPVGDRLSAAAHGVVYGGIKAVSGPTVAGCSVEDSELVVRFNKDMMKGGKLILQNYNQTKGYEMSSFQVLTNISFFCMQPMLRCKKLANGTRPDHCRSAAQEWYCLPELGPNPPSGITWASSGQNFGFDVEGVPPHNPYELPPNWITLNITQTGDSQISVDLSVLNGMIPVAVRYAWGNSRDSCCKNKGVPLIGIGEPCKAAACPIMSSFNLPANPFLARIKNKKCECIPPQKCDN